MAKKRGGLAKKKGVWRKNDICFVAKKLILWRKSENAGEKRKNNNAIRVQASMDRLDYHVLAVVPSKI